MRKDEGKVKIRTGEQMGEEEVAEVVRLHRQFQFVLGQLSLPPIRDPGVVDEHVEPVLLGVDLLGEASNRRERRQVEVAQNHL